MRRLIAKSIRGIVRIAEAASKDEKSELGSDARSAVEAIRALSDAFLHEGRPATLAELDRAGEGFDLVLAAVVASAESEDWDDFEPGDRTLLWELAVRQSALGNYPRSEWIISHGMRFSLFHLYRGRLEENDPWVAAAALMPAVVEGKASFAARCIRLLERTRLHPIAVGWVEDAGALDPEEHPPAVVERIRALAGLEAPIFRPDPTLSPGQRWALLAPPVPSPGDDPRRDLPVSLSVAYCQAELRQDWGVCGPEDLGEVIAWLLDGGHRRQAEATLAAIERGEAPSDDQERHVAAARRLYQRRSALAWDAGRAIWVARLATRAGYLAEVSGWGVALEAARGLRQTYGSWAEAAEGYGLGFSYWREGFAELPIVERAEVVTDSARGGLAFDIPLSELELDEEQIQAGIEERRARGAPPEPAADVPSVIQKSHQHLGWGLVASVWFALAGLALFDRGPYLTISTWLKAQVGIDRPELTIGVLALAPVLVIGLLFRVSTGRGLGDPRRLFSESVTAAGRGLLVALVGLWLLARGVISGSEPATLWISAGVVGFGGLIAGYGLFARRRQRLSAEASSLTGS